MSGFGGGYSPVGDGESKGVPNLDGSGVATAPPPSYQDVANQEPFVGYTTDPHGVQIGNPYGQQPTGFRQPTVNYGQPAHNYRQPTTNFGQPTVATNVTYVAAPPNAFQSSQTSRNIKILLLVTFVFITSVIITITIIATVIL